MKAKFIGKIKGRVETEEGAVFLVVEDTETSRLAENYANEMRRTFNPGSNTHGFGARDIPCKVQPGLSDFRFTVGPDQARGISNDSFVEVELDIFCVRNVRFVKAQNRWAAIPEVRTELINIRPHNEKSGNNGGAKPADK